MEPRLKPSKSSNPLFDVTFYHSIVGSLRYLLHTRPDISFAVGMVSRFMEAPTREHMSAEKHRYIAGTLHYDCSYSRKSGDAGLVGYSDADMAGDFDNRKSTSGTLFFFGYWPVPWQCQKQKVISLSSCESEYIAARAYGLGSSSAISSGHILSWPACSWTTNLQPKQAHRGALSLHQRLHLRTERLPSTHRHRRSARGHLHQGTWACPARATSGKDQCHGGEIIEQQLA